HEDKGLRTQHRLYIEEILIGILRLAFYEDIMLWYAHRSQEICHNAGNWLIVLSRDTPREQHFRSRHLTVEPDPFGHVTESLGGHIAGDRNGRMRFAVPC